MAQCRLRRKSPANSAAFLTVTRLCLDHLKSVRSRETYVGSCLPGNRSSRGGVTEPEDEPEDVTLTSTTALERLSPLERAAFLLHLRLPFDEVAGATAACLSARREGAVSCARAAPALSARRRSGRGHRPRVLRGGGERRHRSAALPPRRSDQPGRWRQKPATLYAHRGPCRSCASWPTRPPAAPGRAQWLWCRHHRRAPRILLGWARCRRPPWRSRTTGFVATTRSATHKLRKVCANSWTSIRSRAPGQGVTARASRCSRRTRQPRPGSKIHVGRRMRGEQEQSELRLVATGLPERRRLARGLALIGGGRRSAPRQLLAVLRVGRACRAGPYCRQRQRRAKPDCSVMVLASGSRRSP